MSTTALITHRYDGGRTRAAVFLPAWIDLSPTYCRALGPRRPSVRTPAMIPDPAIRPVISAEEAFAELGIDRSTGYKAIRDGTFPLPVIRIGRTIRVPTAGLQRLLLIDVSTSDDPGREE